MREQHGVGVRVDVDETGRDGVAARVDHSGAIRGERASDRHDAVARDADVGLDGRCARAVVNDAAAQEQLRAAARPAPWRRGRGG